MEFAVRYRVSASAPQPAAAHRCPQCRVDALVLHRRHVSPPTLGMALVTEYYGCDYCDAEFQFSPGTGRWRPVYQ